MHSSRYLHIRGENVATIGQELVRRHEAFLHRWLPRAWGPQLCLCSSHPRWEGAESVRTQDGDDGQCDGETKPHATEQVGAPISVPKYFGIWWLFFVTPSPCWLRLWSWYLWLPSIVTELVFTKNVEWKIAISGESYKLQSVRVWKHLNHCIRTLKLILLQI